jgi:hypothetical protein
MASKKISQLSSSLAPPLSGVTAVVHNGTTYKSSLSTLKQVLVESGSHYFTGSQFINGNLIVSGSVTAQQYILSSSIANIVTETISGSSNFGNSFDDKHNFTGSVNITGSLNATGSVNITGSLNTKGDLITTGSINVSGSLNTIGDLITTGSINVTDFITASRLNLGDGDILDPDNCEALSVHNSGSWNMAAFEGNVDSFLQFYFVNRSANNNSSTDIVIGNDTGTSEGLEEVLFVDLGMNSSTYNGGFVGRENDAYLFNYSKDFFIGTIQLQDNSCDLHLFTNNSWQNPQMSISGSGQIGFNTSSITDGYQYEFSGSVKLANDIDVIGTGSFNKVTIGPGIIGEIPEEPESLHVGSDNSINIAHFRADNSYYSQVNIQNINSGSFASTDLVLTADNGNEILHYLDLGINSSTYDGGAVGLANDSYLINSGKDMYIGTLGGENYPAEVKLFTMGNWENPQVVLHSTGNTVTFNTNTITDGYTYEFSGSAKFNNDVEVGGATYTNTIHNINDDLNIISENLNNINLFSEGGAVNVTGSLNVTGDVTATSFIGDGSQLDNVVTRNSGSWDLVTGSNDVSFSVPGGHTYSMWVNGNIPDGIVIWNATVTISNTNVPVIGNQYGWYYSDGNALVLTSMPDQIVGTNGSIISTPSSYGPNTSNVFNFNITNNSGASQTIDWGYVKL